ncbi:MAG: hypothetical protein M3458_00565 [Acidobacteriota bacterium]|nr:hypothetical protein [Acidobacteriota bacterium]
MDSLRPLLARIRRFIEKRSSLIISLLIKQFRPRTSAGNDNRAVWHAGCNYIPRNSKVPRNRLSAIDKTMAKQRIEQTVIT